jgi:hypothetical protein
MEMPNLILLPAFRVGRTCLGLIIFFTASVLSAQLREPVRSIRMHGEIESNGRALNLTQVVKGQDLIRASIMAPVGSTSVTVYFNNKKIYLEEDLPDKKSLRELSGEDAAAYLLDLLALNPAYHFHPEKGFNLQHPLFAGFSLEIKRTEPPEGAEPVEPGDPDKEVRPIEYVRLIDLSLARNPIIRTIRYLENFPAGKHGQTPRKIAFIDDTTGQGGTITLKEFHYNVGLADFLFQPKGIASDRTKKR